MPRSSCRPGLLLGAIGMVFASAAAAQQPAPAPAPVHDLRSAQVLLEGGVFLSQAEIEAAFARFGVDRPTDKKRPIPNAKAYWEQGAASFGQAERARRLGSGGSASQFRLGVDQEVRPGVVVGGMAGAGVGSVSSGDLFSQSLAAHADLYAGMTHGPAFLRGLLGATTVDFDSLGQGPEDDRCHGQAVSTDLRAAGQVGGTFEVESLRITPTAMLSLHANRLSGFDVRGDNGGLSFAARRATAAIGTIRLTGARTVRVAPNQNLDLEAFVGADEVLGFESDRLRARSDASQITAAVLGKPTGRGVVGGLGVGTSLAQGVELKVNYDYGARDGVSTRTGRARLGVSF
jgi:hypothetical protein